MNPDLRTIAREARWAAERLDIAAGRCTSQTLAALRVDEINVYLSDVQAIRLYANEALTYALQALEDR